MVVTFVLMALFGLSVQAGLFAFIELDEQHVKLTDDEGEDRNIQISSNDVFCASSPAHSWCKFLGNCLRCLEDLVDEDDMLDPLLAITSWQLLALARDKPDDQHVQGDA